MRVCGPALTTQGADPFRHPGLRGPAPRGPCPGTGHWDKAGPSASCLLDTGHQPPELPGQGGRAERGSPMEVTSGGRETGGRRRRRASQVSLALTRASLERVARSPGAGRENGPGRSWSRGTGDHAAWPRCPAQGWGQSRSAGGAPQSCRGDSSCLEVGGRRGSEEQGRLTAPGLPSAGADLDPAPHTRPLDTVAAARHWGSSLSRDTWPPPSAHSHRLGLGGWRYAARQRVGTAAHRGELRAEGL